MGSGTVRTAQVLAHLFLCDPCEKVETVETLGSLLRVFRSAGWRRLGELVLPWRVGPTPAPAFVSVSPNRENKKRKRKKKKKNRSVIVYLYPFTPYMPTRFRWRRFCFRAPPRREVVAMTLL